MLLGHHLKEKKRIIRGKEIDKQKWKQSKEILDQVLGEITSTPDLSDVTLQDLLTSCDVSHSEYSDALQCSQQKVSIIYKRKPCEKYISPYNTVMLSLLKSNMNIQFVTGIYGLLAYLMSYMCKPERVRMSELMKKASKEASGKDVKDKLRSIGNVFLTKREVSTHEAIVRSLSLQMRTSNITTVYIPTGIKKNRTRMLKDQSVLETMDPEDSNVYQTNMLDKYANRPDDLEEMCYADVSTTYISKSAIEVQVESEDIQYYTMPIGAIEEVEPTSRIIALKNDLGKMKKGSRPCVIRYHKVTKLKDCEQYYMIVLQLYTPWRNEDNIKGDCPTYGEKFISVELSIKPNILKHDPNFEKYDIDLDDLHHYADSESESDEGDHDFGMINPDLIDLDYDENSDDGNTTVPVPSTTVENVSIPLELFYDMCSKLNPIPGGGGGVKTTPWRKMQKTQNWPVLAFFSTFPTFSFH